MPQNRSHKKKKKKKVIGKYCEKTFYIYIK